eukprot:646480-Prorocentrum_minimum.AAC.2
MGFVYVSGNGVRTIRSPGWCARPRRYCQRSLPHCDWLPRYHQDDPRNRNGGTLRTGNGCILSLRISRTVFCFGASFHARLSTIEPRSRRPPKPFTTSRLSIVESMIGHITPVSVQYPEYSLEYSTNIPCQRSTKWRVHPR